MTSRRREVLLRAHRRHSRSPTSTPSTRVTGPPCSGSRPRASTPARSSSRRSFAPLGRSTMPAGAGLVVSKKAVQKLGKKFATHPIGTGPYEFTSWTPKQKIVLNRFDKYAGANKGFVRGPFFEAINIIPIVNDSAAETALRAGDIDFTEIATGSVDRLKADSRFQSVSRNTLDYQFLAMNVTDPLLKDLNLRLAIRYGDRRAGHHRGGLRRQVDARERDHPEEHGPRLLEGRARLRARRRQGQGLPGQDGHEQHHADARRPGRRGRQDRRPGDPGEPQGHRHHDRAEDHVDSATFNAIPGAGGGGKNRQLVYGGYVTEPDPRGRPSGSRVRRTASGTGTTGATRAASTACTTRPSRRRTRPSARSSTSSCRSSGMPRRAWSGSRIRRASTPVARA